MIINVDEGLLIYDCDGPVAIASSPEEAAKWCNAHPKAKMNRNCKCDWTIAPVEDVLAETGPPSDLQPDDTGVLHKPSKKKTDLMN